MGAILSSDVCMSTVSESTEKNPDFAEKVQDASKEMSEDTKADIKGRIETALDEFRASAGYDEAKEKQYVDLADLFGITLDNAALPTP